MGTFVLIIIIGLITFFVYSRFRKNFKFVNEPSICLVTGGVKTGKSMFSVNLSHKAFFKIHRLWFFKTHFLRKDIEEPLFYTNTYNNFGFFHKRLNRCIRYIGTEHLLRNYRFNYKSVVFIDECSLMADNMDFKNIERNIELSLFNKLFAHSTKGGRCYYDTQSPLDSHYSIKRVCSTFFFIQKQRNFGLFHILYVREFINTDIGVNNFHDDVDTTTRKVIIPFWWHKHYNRYYLSYLTDDLPTENKDAVIYGDLVSFNPLYVQLADKRKKEVVNNSLPKDFKEQWNNEQKDFYGQGDNQPVDINTGNSDIKIVDNPPTKPTIEDLYKERYGL